MNDAVAPHEVVDGTALELRPTEPTQPGPKPTDDELGERLIERWQGRYRYFFGAWHLYQDGMWKPARQQILLDIWELLKEAKREGIRPTANKVSSVEIYCSLMLMIDDDVIDGTMNYINLQNGLYNLETDRLEPHHPDLFMTSQLPFDYDENADCPNFQKFLNQVVVLPNGETDWKMQQTIQEAFGYSLTADTGYRVSFWLVGESGTGKSTLLDVLIALAGNSHTSIDLDQLRTSTYQLADIAGKRVVTFTEPETNAVLADNHYKRLVSRDVITARQIFGKPFRFIPICKLWGAMNTTPRVVDRSDAIYSRVMIFPMNRIIPERKRDGQLYLKLHAELPGIFNWALAGLTRLRRANRFTHSDQVENARAEYKAANDTEALYADEKLKFDPNARVLADVLYRNYRAWCLENGYSPKSKAIVAQQWKRLGLTPQKSNDFRYWRGCEIIDPGGDEN